MKANINSNVVYSSDNGKITLKSVSLLNYSPLLMIRTSSLWFLHVIISIIKQLAWY